MSSQRPAPAVLAVLAALAAVVLVVTGWALGQHGPVVPRASAAVTADPTGGRARDGVLVSGTGRVNGRPDTLTAEFGAQARASSVDGALRRADRAIARITDALRRGGVDGADLQTASVDIYPTYDEGGRVTGYEAQQRLTVTFHDVDRAGTLISRAVSAGGDAARLSSLAFRVDDDSALLADARRKAFADAKAKAELYAQASGRGLARVVSVTESVSGGHVPVDTFDSAAGAARAVPLEPGQQELSVTVDVEWAFS